MEKPQGFDELNVGSFEKITEGGHHLVIKQVTEQDSKAGKMLVVLFDTAKNDSQPGYFSNLFDTDVRPEKKWPFNGRKYILEQDYEDKSKVNKDFKRFITAFERSNNTTCQWGNDFFKQFTGKKIGGVFGAVENEYNGKTSMRNEIRWFCEDSVVEGAKIPNPKYLKKQGAGAGAGKEDFLDIPEGTDGEIPF